MYMHRERERGGGGVGEAGRQTVKQMARKSD